MSVNMSLVPRELQRCATCYFFYAGEDDRNACHRRSPVVDGIDEVGYWPTVSKKHWCGEYAALLDPDGMFRGSLEESEFIAFLDSKGKKVSE